MLCAIYKSSKKEGAYLYIPKKDDFSQVPDALMQMFGKPTMVMMIKLDGRQLATVDIEKVSVFSFNCRHHQRIFWKNTKSRKKLANSPKKNNNGHHLISCSRRAM